MKHTMLTADTLTRFERCVNINTLTDDTINTIEHFAYAANMGKDSDEAAWSWFRHLVADNFQILLPEFEDTNPKHATEPAT